MKEFNDLFELFNEINNMFRSFENNPVYEDIKFCDIINTDKKVLEQIVADRDVDYLRALRTDIIQKYNNIESKYKLFIDIINAYITAKTTDAQKPKIVTMTEEEINAIIAEAVEKATGKK